MTILTLPAGVRSHREHRLSDRLAEAISDHGFTARPMIVRDGATGAVVSWPSGDDRLIAAPQVEEDGYVMWRFTLHADDARPGDLPTVDRHASNREALYVALGLLGAHALHDYPSPDHPSLIAWRRAGLGH